MRKNKQDRHAKYKCSHAKCQNSGITGVYFRDGNYYCGRGCYRKANPRKKGPNIIKVSSAAIARLRGLVE